ncbi:MAG: radical SAM protein [Planctomycetota bacterium]|nr:radical SAM protein [Planctomycetota bacterium]
MDTRQKLRLLADASRYDLACACGTNRDEHRRRNPDGMWLYPASLPGGGTSILLKTLLSSTCVNDCRYCPLRSDRSVRRCTLGSEEIAEVFMDYVRRRRVVGMFLSSAVCRSPDHTMDRMIAVADILRRKHRYRGYLHLKVIPGASDAAIEQMLSLASTVSLNVEAPTRSAFASLSKAKDYDRHIVQPTRLISRLTARGNRYAGVKQTTQFVVGASDETDADLVRATFGLYRRLRLNRVYFSAYQQGLGDPSLPGERNAADPHGLLTREHRLYQADFLIRQYKWDLADICFEAGGNLSLAVDPKQQWADRHPEFFPVRLRSAGRDALLRVPGLGPITAGRILRTRRKGILRSLKDVGLRGKRLQKASGYVVME